MEKNPPQLPIPEAAESDPKSRELLRVWAAGGRQHITLATGLWKDPASWGIMLVDLAKHIADGYQQRDGRSIDETLARIKTGFDAEWNFPTGKPSGVLTKSPDDKPPAH